MKYLLTNFILIFLIVSGCKKNNAKSKQLIDCYDAISTDSGFVNSNLIGTWQWKKVACFWTNQINNADKNTIVTFNNNFTFIIKENGITVSQGSWSIQTKDAPYYGLITTVSTNYLNGRIIFCNNQMLFNNSYIDGCDNLFVRL